MSEQPSIECNPTVTILQRDYASLRAQVAAITKDRDEARKWKEEDPRMLREQVRVADVAFNHLHGQHKSTLDRLHALEQGVKVAVGALQRMFKGPSSNQPHWMIDQGAEEALAALAPLLTTPTKSETT